MWQHTLTIIRGGIEEIVIEFDYYVEIVWNAIMWALDIASASGWKFVIVYHD